MGYIPTLRRQRQGNPRISWLAGRARTDQSDRDTDLKVESGQGRQSKPQDTIFKPLHTRYIWEQQPHTHKQAHHTQRGCMCVQKQNRTKTLSLRVRFQYQNIKYF